MIEIYRSSRIEQLADLLAVHLQQQAPLSVLTPQLLIVGHLGMKRWLTQRLASLRLPGRPRIAANFEMLLPSEWLDRLAQQTLGRHSIAIAPYRRTALRWRIHALLPTLAEPEVQRYLHGDGAPRRHFQLADRLAGLFGQYLVYRRDWLREWEQGRDAGVPHWQNALWRCLVADIGLDHRGRRMGDLAARLPRLPADPEMPSLQVFGVSHLPPDALAALDALSHSRTVQIYFPDPCRELWQDLRTQRAVYAASLSGEAYLEIGHPLLAMLGRMGQHFTLLLNGLDAGCDLRHQEDEQTHGCLPAPHTLLERVQHSIRTLRPDWVQPAPGAAGDGRLDSSLRVHVCHTRLRELEVLKDALLEQLAQADQPGRTALHPKDIVVMAPNMALYAPLLPVVFGAAGDAHAVLPYQIADVALARTHPLLGAVRELIDLPSQRITRSQVLSLLALPAVERRFGLDASSRAALTRWLDRAHVAWGLDGPMKASFGAAPVDDHSFAFGFDRMFAGAILGDVADDVLLDGDILPVRPVAGPDAASLGALWGLLAVLGEWRHGAAGARSLEVWSQQLRDWMERLFEVDPRDDGEREALAAVMSLIAGLADQERDAGIAVAVEWAVVRDVLKQGLEGVPERQPFLAGGITFCGMVPQRSIPFKVIALLGLNDGDYPRPRPDTGLDLMQTYPRLGDRDNRSDDRYLFLEALMSARLALHLSYVGEGVQDGKARNPAMPLAELLGFLDREYGHNPRASHYDPPWRVRHPLQAFDARYFDPASPDPRLYSYSQAFAGLRADAAASEWQFMAGKPSLATAGTEAGAAIELKSLAAFFKDPSRWVCRQALLLSRDALDDAAPNDDEPLATAPEHLDTVRTDLVWDALHRGHDTLPVDAPPSFRRSGQYASGALGAMTWETVRTQAQAFLTAARALPPFAAGAALPQAQAVDLQVEGVRLIGSVNRIYATAGERWLVGICVNRPTFRHLLPLYLDWAALCLSQPETPCRLAFIYHDPTNGILSDPPIAFCRDHHALQHGLAALLQLYRHAEDVAGLYFARTSYQLASALHRQPQALDKALAEAATTWGGNAGARTRGERDFLPLYNRMLAGDEAFLQDGHPQQQRMVAIARSLLQVLTGSAPAAEAS